MGMNTGKVSENVLKRSVLRQIKTRRKEVAKGAEIGGDCAFFSFPGNGSMMTCVQEGIVTVKRDGEGIHMPGERILTMSRLIHKCANNLAAAGAESVAVMLAMLLPQSTEEPEIKALMAEAEDRCRELDIQIAGGQTRITGAVTAPIVTVTAYGLPFPVETARGTGRQARNVSGGREYGTGAASPGQDVVISKWIGLEGTAILAEQNRDRLLQRYPAYLVEEAASFGRWLSVVPEAATAVKSGVCAMHDASEGGIFGALWELAEGAGVGLTIDLKKLPLRQETVEVCECCNVNPYELLSGGCLVMTTGDGPGLAAALEARGIPAAIVGKVTDSNDRIIMNEDEVRFLEKPKRDEIYR